MNNPTPPSQKDRDPKSESESGFTSFARKLFALLGLLSLRLTSTDGQGVLAEPPAEACTLIQILHEAECWDYYFKTFKLRGTWCKQSMVHYYSSVRQWEMLQSMASVERVDSIDSLQRVYSESYNQNTGLGQFLIASPQNHFSKQWIPSSSKKKRNVRTNNDRMPR